MTQYNPQAIQAAIDQDPAIGPAEGRAIHALLKGRSRAKAELEAGHRGDHARCGPCDIILNDMDCWLHDCEISTTDATAYGITAMVERAYDGGIDQFLLDGPTTQ
jgi:hypothetical protein